MKVFQTQKIVCIIRIRVEPHIQNHKQQTNQERNFYACQQQSVKYITALLHFSTMPSQSSYYDIDAILAEEELVPCTTQFDFSYLAHLDPDVHDKSYLPEGSRVKLPLWAVEKWAEVNFVSLALPRHYQRKSRERLEAAPSEVNLR